MMLVTKRKFYIALGFIAVLLCSVFLYFGYYLHRTVNYDKRFFNEPARYETSKIIIYKAERELELYADLKLIGLFKVALGSNPVGQKNNARKKYK